MNTFILFLAILNPNNIQQNLVRDYAGFTSEKACQEVADEFLKRLEEKYKDTMMYTAVCIEVIE